MGVRYLIGLDDTDAGDSIGTGGLARELEQLLVRDHGADRRGITRHQLFVHPDIPYTSHNSSACIEIECHADAAELAAACRRFITYLFHPGADPGLCIVSMSSRQAASGAAVDATAQATTGKGLDEAVRFGRRAQREIVTRDEAGALAHERGFLLEGLGGTGLGVIGAFAACALRMGGGDGRFLSLQGTRGIKGELTVAELRGRTPIAAVVDQEGRALDDATVVDTRDWVRPELVERRIVLPVIEVDGRYRVAGKKGRDND